MRTIISGPVTADDITYAGLMAGITPTAFLTNGHHLPPAELGMKVEVDPPCAKIGGRVAVQARDYTLCQRADAVIVRGADEHLVRVATQYGLRVCQL